ncbi:collagen binding domain-containing protein [Alkaliphilus hydrothermalis]|uniref:LPXTG-motif cell wall-anchored protein n=1 Tax=Alkaliphilus hydrothermalis TaxID=1482730 RepID=A0ABS2NSK5_9FIRM|nr:collagen binding domain-containing protein [Alkaliphilus hydrothermalis]MBM7615752.1 LPXTG-motif cell wall-anchored protein [Alkaliphilus hydrothermalis]
MIVKLKKSTGGRFFSLLTALMMLAYGLIQSTNFLVYAGVPDPLAGFEISGATITRNGEEINAITSPLKQNETIKLSYTWSILDTDHVAEGDTISVAVPTILDLGEDNISGTLLGDDGMTSFGTWDLNVSTSQLSLSLSSVPASLSNVRGTVEFTLNFRAHEEIVEVPYEIRIPLSGGLEKTYTVSFEIPGGVSLDKTGAQSGMDPNTITWQVDINKNLLTVSTPVITDEIDPLLDYVDGSIEIYKLKAFSNGTYSQEATPIDGSLYTTNYGGNQLTVSFNGEIDGAYRLIYDTTIDSDQIDTSRTSFNYRNDVSYNGVKDSATVNITRGALLVKDGTADKAYNADHITWSISLNQALYPLKNVSVEDNIPSGLGLDIASINVYRMPGKVLVDPAAYSLSFNGDNTQFTVALGDINQEYVVEYVTDINVEEKKNNNGSLAFTNNAKLYQGLIGDIKTNTTSDTVNITKGRILQKSGSATISYNDDKTITWTTDVNLAEVDLGTVAFTDSIIGEHKLDEAFGIQVYPITIDHTQASNNLTIGAQLSEGTDYHLTTVGSDPIKEFSLDFGGNITQPYRIVYRTIITEKTTQTFTNTAYIGANDGTPDATGSVSPTIVNTFSKSYTGVDFVTKELNWRLNVNPVQQGINNLMITDTLSEGLVMSNDQIAALSVRKGGVELIKDTDYTISETIVDGKIKGFEMSFLSEVNDAEYVVTYSTFMDLDVLSNNGHLKYDNTAEFSIDGGSTTRKATPGFNNIILHNGSKSGVLDANQKQLHWTINTNHLSKNIDDFEVMDTILGNQKLVPGSVEIYSYSLDGAGNITVGALVDPVLEGFTIEEGGDGSYFKVIYPPLINSPYLIRYSTEFTGISQTTYANVAVTNKNESYSTNVSYSDGNKFVSKTGTRNGITSVDWTITLNKSQSTIAAYTLTDRLSEGLELVEDSFVVRRKDGTVVDFDTIFRLNVHPRVLAIEPQSFDLISRIPITETYTITYTTNIIIDEILENRVSNNITFVGEQVVSGVRQDTVTIIHTFITGSGTGVGEVGSFKLIKENATGERLPNARFELYKGAKYIGVVNTDINGELEVNRLKYGNYILKEVQAPVGYRLLADNVEVNISSPIQEVVTVVNTKNPPPVIIIPEPQPEPEPTPEEPIEEEPEKEPEEEQEPPVEPEEEADEEPVKETVETKTMPKETPTQGKIEVPDKGVITISEEPQNGTVTVDKEGNWTYTPDPDFIGKDQIKISITDEEGNLEEIIFEILVEEIPEGAPDITDLPEELPKTGETNRIWFYLLGIAMMITGYTLRKRFS